MVSQTVVTTVQHPNDFVQALAKDMCVHLQACFVPREQSSLDKLRERFSLNVIAVATKRGPRLEMPGGSFFFHPSMAALRMKNVNDGLLDHMVAAMQLRPGMTVLDCTLGLGTDAIIASHISNGGVTGLEASPLLAYVTAWGLQHPAVELPEVLRQAMRSINVRNCNYDEYLHAQPDNAYDVVYFDPMFSNPIWGSSNMRPLRWLAERTSLVEETLIQAKRVARHRVVIKTAVVDNLFSNLGVDELAGGKYSRVKYGILNI